MTRLAQLAAELARAIPNQSAETARPQAAVALMLAPDPDRLLVIHRAERAGDPWSGHLALPGGRRAPQDIDLLATAIRETAEETGIALQRDWCVAQLDDLVPRTPTLPPLLVRPFVFLLAGSPVPGMSAEVVGASWLPLGHLLADGVFASRTVDLRGEPRRVCGYQLPEGFLWGMTERILTPVLQQWHAIADAG